MTDDFVFKGSSVFDGCICSACEECERLNHEMRRIAKEVQRSMLPVAPVLRETARVPAIWSFVEGRFVDLPPLGEEPTWPLPPTSSSARS